MGWLIRTDVRSKYDGKLGLDNRSIDKFSEKVSVGKLIDGKWLLLRLEMSRRYIPSGRTALRLRSTDCARGACTDACCWSTNSSGTQGSPLTHTRKQCQQSICETKTDEFKIFLTKTIILLFRCSVLAHILWLASICTTHAETQATWPQLSSLRKSIEFLKIIWLTEPNYISHVQNDSI